MAETKRTLPVEDYLDEKAEEKRPEKAPDDFTLLKRIERDIARLSPAGRAYLDAKLARKEG